MKRCPQCNKTFPDAERFCADDGTALVSVGGPATTRVDEAPGGAGREARIECPVCGGKAEPGEIICNFCGARLDSSWAAPPPEPGAATPSQSLRSPTPRPTGTARVQHTFPDEPLDDEDEEEGSRRWIGIIGYTVAALVALIGGAWLALHLTKSSHPPVAQASPAAPTGVPTPAAVAAAPSVTLASTIPTQVSGPAAADPQRSRDAIEKVFDSNRAALLDIYSRALDTDSTAHDGMLVHVSVDAGGKVTASAINTSTAPNPSLDAEVLNSIANWDFGPSSSGAAEADLPIIFSHGGAEASATESALSTKLAALNPSEPPEYALVAASPTVLPTPAVAAFPPPPVAALPPPPVAALPPPPVTAPTPHRRHTRVASARPPRPTLLEKVQDRLRVDPRTRRVKAYTNTGGVVTLYGKVFDDKARRVAINNVRGVSGVNDVIDNLRTDTGEWQLEQDAILRQLQGAGLTGVTVKVIGKQAFLDGQVNSALDRDRAVTITEGAAPVKVRTNLIRVAPGSVFGF